MSQLELYFIPGLGLDEKIFQNLQFDSYSSTYLNWIEPIEKESIKQYAKRYASQFLNRNTKKVFITHSFGGILAQEMSNYIPIECIFLISSIKSRQEMPWFLKILSKLNVQGINTKSLIIKTFKFWAKRHGYHSIDLKNVFINSVNQQSSKILNWSIDQLSSWKEIKYDVNNLIQIHGEKDKTFPINLITNPNYVISDGDHNMVFYRSEEIKRIIINELVNFDNISETEN